MTYIIAKRRKGWGWTFREPAELAFVLFTFHFKLYYNYKHSIICNIFNESFVTKQTR